ncbi:hypothetical protein D3C72_2512270 [compost metagenome]
MARQRAADQLHLVLTNAAGLLRTGTEFIEQAISQVFQAQYLLTRLAHGQCRAQDHFQLPDVTRPVEVA